MGLIPVSQILTCKIASRPYADAEASLQMGAASAVASSNQIYRVSQKPRKSSARLVVKIFSVND